MANNFQPIGSEIQVNSVPFGDQRDADVAALTDGRFFVAYTYVWSGTDHDIYGQFVSGDGIPVGPFIAVNFDGQGGSRFRSLTRSGHSRRSGASVGGTY